MPRRSKSSTSRPSRVRLGGVSRVRRADGGLDGRRDSGGRRITVLRQHPKVWDRGAFYPRQAFAWPTFVLPQGCPPPLSRDCAMLKVTPRWAIACFKPTYHRLRMRYGSNYEAIVNALLDQTVPDCNLRLPQRGAEHELHRRIALAVAVLMNREGIPVRYPPEARFPKPDVAASISQPWLRALLTGWF